MITLSHFGTFTRVLSEALSDQKTWVGYDNSIEQLSAYDLHFFSSPQKAADFQLFNHGQGKEVALLPAEALLVYLQESLNQLTADGKHVSSIELDDETVLAFFADRKINQQVTELGELMDGINWRTISYEPGMPLHNFEEKIAFNQLEYTLNRLSGLAQSGQRGQTVAKEFVQRYWSDSPMNKLSQEVLSGKYASLNTQIIIHHKTDVMNTDNMEYLQNQLKYLGFGEGLNAALEKNLKEGLPDFQLQASHAFGKDQMEATLYFKKSEREGMDMYFFNKYDASLKQGEHSMNQTFYINNKGQSITFKEACNLLNGRAVYKELAPKDNDKSKVLDQGQGEGVKETTKYKAWVKLDFSERDEKGNAKVKQYHENYGFDVKEALSRIPLKELSDPEKMQTLVASLEKGNLASATLVKDGAEKNVQLTTDPQYKTLKMYDSDGKKLYVPAEKPDMRYGQAPADEKRMSESLQVGENVGKNIDLLPVHENGKEAGQKLTM